MPDKEESSCSDTTEQVGEAEPGLELRGDGT